MDATQLKRIPLFADVPDEDLKVITTFARSEEFPEGDVIIKEGAFSNKFYAIEEGEAEVQRDGQTVGKLGGGDIFGEAGLLEKAPRSASVVVTKRLKAIVIEHWELSRMKKSLPETWEKIRAMAEERAAASE